MAYRILRTPLPTSANRLFVRTRGRTIVSKDYKAFKQLVWCEYVAAYPQERCLRGPVSATIYLRFPDRRKQDIDNRVKGLIDACDDAGMMIDDSQIVEIRVVKAKRLRKPGSAIIILREVPEWRLVHDVR